MVYFTYIKRGELVMAKRMKKILLLCISLVLLALLASCNSTSDDFPETEQPSVTTTVTTKKAGKTIPDLIIKTESSTPITSNETYLVASVSITGETDTTLDREGAQIRGRGNSTWRFFDKKSYRIKFDEKVDLFGMGAARDYNLLANAMDMTMMQNYIALTLMAQLDDSFTPKCTFVHLHLNGQYMGVFLLTERIEQDKERLDIGSGKSGEPDVGYLVEFGGNVDYKEKPNFKIDPVEFNGKTIAWRDAFRAVIKSPDETIVTKEQKKYIEEYIEKVNRAIYTQDFETFSELCDVDSFVANVLVNELMLANDFDFNFHMYKEEGGKLFLGPIWDFDQACGISTKSGGTMYGWTVSKYPCWITSLLEMPQFYELVRQKWIDNYDLIHGITAEIYEKAEQMQYDINLNFRCWDVLGKPYWRMTEEMADLDTYEGFLDRLAWWLDNRIIWIDKEFGLFRYDYKPSDN
jgi:hypothetical protein